MRTKQKSLFSIRCPLAREAPSKGLKMHLPKWIEAYKINENSDPVEKYINKKYDLEDITGYTNRKLKKTLKEDCNDMY